MHKAETAKPINTLSFIDRGFDSRKSGSILHKYGITLLRKNVPLLPQLPQLPPLPLTTTLIQQPLI
jgi:hypothetical protein